MLLPICEPWKTLCERNERFADLFQNIGIAYDQPPPPKVKPTREALVALSLSELFDCIDKVNRVRILNVLEEKVSPQDENLLRENLSSDNKYRVRLALRGLGKLGTVKAFEALKTYIEGSENADQMVRGDAFVAIAEMPGALTLETARRWFRCKELHLQIPGGNILGDHATLEDVPLLIEALRTPETVRCEDSRLTSALVALARFDGIGPIPEIEQVFCQAPDCFDRCRAANAMAVTAPAQFRDQYAFECLWDCHWNTRILGCKTVSPSTPEVLERLKEIAEDACESDNVRQAAQERLEGF